MRANAEVAPDRRHGWPLVAALSLTQTIAWGVLYYAFAVLLIPMTHDTGWSTLTLTGAFSTALAVSAIAGLAVGSWLDHHGPRTLMTTGSLLAIALVAAWSRVDRIVELYAVFAGIGLAMAMVLYEPAIVVLTKWVPQRRRAVTTLTLVAALASFIFLPLTEQLVGAYGWRDALLVLAAVLVPTALIHAAFLPARPASAAQPRDSPRRDEQLDRVMPLLAASFTLGMFVTTAATIHLVAVLITSGHPPARAATLAGIVGLGQILGRLMFAVAGDHLHGPRVPLTVFGAIAVALALLALNRSTLAVVVFALLFGAGAGASTLARAVLIGDLYGPSRYGAVNGTIAAPATVARAAAPFSAALLVLLPGAHTTMLLLLASASIAAALIGASSLRAVTSTHGASSTCAIARGAALPR